MLRKTDLSRALQLMHAEGVRNGGKYRWVKYFEPEPEIIEAFEKAASRPAADWNLLEPEFK